MRTIVRPLQKVLRRPWCILPLYCLLSSCAALDDTITGLPQGSSKVFYESGRTSLISTKKHSVKVIPPPTGNYSPAEPHMAFTVVGVNRSDETFDFLPSSISAKWESKKWMNPPRENLVVYNYSQMLKKLKGEQASANFAAVLGGVAGAYNAAQAGTTTTYGSVGNTSFSATSYNSGLSTALAVQNANQTASNLNQISRSADQAKSDLGRSLLRRQTMLPMSMYGGQLILENPLGWSGHGGKIYLTVPIGNEIHKFVFQVDTYNDKATEKGQLGFSKKRYEKTYSGSD